MHRQIIGASRAVMVVAVCAAGCSKAPTAPAHPAAQPVPPAPQAVLSISAGEIEPPIAFGGLTPIRFDASRSTGTGLTYRIDFGDGTTSADAIATHVPASLFEAGMGRDLTATLTVTDALGRTASTTARYLVAGLSNRSATFWFQLGNPANKLTFLQDGGAVSGWYRTDGGSTHFTGTLGSDRVLTLRTDDGKLEFTGSVVWRDDPRYGLSSYGLVLRLIARRAGVADVSMDFVFHDPY